MSSLNLVQRTFVRRFERELATFQDMKVTAAIYQEMFKKHQTAEPGVYDSFGGLSGLPIDLSGIKGMPDETVTFGEYADFLFKAASFHIENLQNEIKEISNDAQVCQKFIESDAVQRLIGERTRSAEAFEAYVAHMGGERLGVDEQTLQKYGIDPSGFSGQR